MRWVPSAPMGISTRGRGAGGPPVPRHLPSPRSGPAGSSRVMVFHTEVWDYSRGLRPCPQDQVTLKTGRGRLCQVEFVV